MQSSIRLIALISVVLAALTSGCLAHTAVPSRDGRAYVIKSHAFGSSAYLCEENKDRPKCWEVVEEEAP